MSNTRDYAVGWFTLSLTNAGLAQAKGRSRLGGCFASLRLGNLCTWIIDVIEAVKSKA